MPSNGVRSRLLTVTCVVVRLNKLPCVRRFLRYRPPVGLRLTSGTFDSFFLLRPKLRFERSSREQYEVVIRRCRRNLWQSVPRSLIRRQRLWVRPQFRIRLRSPFLSICWRRWCGLLGSFSSSNSLSHVADLPVSRWARPTHTDEARTLIIATRGQPTTIRQTITTATTHLNPILRLMEAITAVAELAPVARLPADSGTTTRSEGTGAALLDEP
jgi:hypothetical protein